jgi:hypothetical protein
MRQSVRQIPSCVSVDKNGPSPFIAAEAQALLNARGPLGKPNAGGKKLLWTNQWINWNSSSSAMLVTSAGVYRPERVSE